MLRSIVARWACEGHRVEVLSTQPSYKPGAGIPRQPSVEQLDKVRVRRLSLPMEAGRPLIRAFNLMLFSVAILRYALMRGKFDVIMASTAPPVFIGAAARLAARLTGARFIYHCMDIHPEIGRISGEFSNPLLFSALQRIDAKSCRVAARVVVLSRDMAKVIRKRKHCRDARVEIINNFNLPSFESVEQGEIPVELTKDDRQFRLLFAGNLGRFQGLETVIDAMRYLSDLQNVELVFMGEGKSVDSLRRQAGDLNGNQVKFFPHQPVDLARAVIQSADLCLVSLTPGIYQYAFPSKTMTYLGEGRPLLVSVESESELADFVRHEQIGITVAPGDAAGMADAIRRLIGDVSRKREMAARARAAGEAYFAESVVLNHWSELMESIAGEVN
jgi:glycosyltransferase involved in cell wall biosynthesis